MRAVTLLALWFTVYGNINKTGKNAMICNYHVYTTCLNNLSPILIVVSNRCEFHSQVVPINIHT